MHGQGFLTQYFIMYWFFLLLAWKNKMTQLHLYEALVSMAVLAVYTFWIIRTYSFQSPPGSSLLLFGPGSQCWGLTWESQGTENPKVALAEQECEINTTEVTRPYVVKVWNCTLSQTWVQKEPVSRSICTLWSSHKAIKSQHKVQG